MFSINISIFILVIELLSSTLIANQTTKQKETSIESLKKNTEFQAVYKKGKSYANKYLVMYVLENQSNKNRIGISVSKKVGNSVKRNRAKRLMKESTILLP